MKKTFLLTFVVSAAALTLVVAIGAKAKPDVTISTSRPVITFGGSVTLSGAISNEASQTSHSVGVLAKQYGQAAGYVSIAAVPQSVRHRATPGHTPPARRSRLHTRRSGRRRRADR